MNSQKSVKFENLAVVSELTLRQPTYGSHLWNISE